MADRSSELIGLVMREEESIYDAGYASLPRCGVCYRAVGDVDCDRDLELPTHLRMCFSSIEFDPTCIPGLRDRPSGL